MNLTITIDTGNKEELINLREMINSLLNEPQTQRRNNDLEEVKEALIHILSGGPMKLSTIIECLDDLRTEEMFDLNTTPEPHSLRMLFASNRDTFEFIGDKRTGKWQLKKSD
jgi:hypothetical protein